MKLFSLLLGAALVSGASAAPCDTCRAGGFVATCTSKTVDLTCKVPTTGTGNFLDATAKQCKACENQFTKTCTSATVGLTCRTAAAGARGNFLDSATAVATPVCTQCDATCATCSAAAANKCITCIHGLFGGAASPGAACGNSCAAAAQTADVQTLKALTCESATKDLTCPALSVLGGDISGGTAKCIKCKANTATCTKATSGVLTTQASTVSVNCLTGFGGAAGTCAACEAAGGDLVVPVSCESATKATTCPPLSVLGGVAGSEKCIACSANTATCTKSGVAVTAASTISTKCSQGFYIAAGSPATCVACTSEVCTTGTKMKKFASAAAACPLGTDTANPGLAATNCMSCHGGATCTAAVANKAPVAALTCAATSQKREADGDEFAATKCLPGAFGDNVADCLANCANVDGTANVAECACGKETGCTAGQGCTAADLTKAGACADIKKQAAKKSPASTMQASALLSAAALLVAMRQ